MIMAMTDAAITPRAPWIAVATQLLAGADAWIESIMMIRRHDEVIHSMNSDHL
jgi:hypothetical protein